MMANDATGVLANRYVELTRDTTSLVAQVTVLLDAYHENGRIHEEVEEAVLETISRIQRKRDGTEDN